MIPRLLHAWGFDEYPYDALAGTGITPHSSHDEVLDRFFEMQGPDWTQELRRALDEIRRPESRLVVDFFLYEPLFARPESLVELQLQKLLAAVSCLPKPEDEAY